VRRWEELHPCLPLSHREQRQHNGAHGTLIPGVPILLPGLTSERRETPTHGSSAERQEVERG
jgi:hypothetical protein